MVVALFVFSLAVILAVSMTSQQSIDIRRTSNVLDYDQAKLYTFALEQWGGRILTQDAEDTEYDHNGETWAREIQPFPVEGGQIVGRATDLGGRFNINNLIQNEKVNAQQLAILRRLLANLRLDTAIADAVLDWIDENNEPTFPDGAEELDYLSLDTPYRAANEPIMDISELRLIKGVTAEVFAVLRPHVTALPENNKLNVNSITPELMRALAEGVSASDAEKLINGQERGGYDELNKFLQHEVWEGKAENERPNGGFLAVTTDYFGLEAQAQIGRGRAKLVSIVKRSKDGATVLSRSWGE